MSKELNKYTVHILGNAFTLVTDEPESDVMEAAKLADSTLNAIVGDLTTFDLKNVAILGALQLANKCISLQKAAVQANQVHQGLIERIDQEITSQDEK